MLYFLEIVPAKMDGNLQVYVIFTDRSKAFDKVDPLIIIIKKYDVGSCFPNRF